MIACYQAFSPWPMNPEQITAAGPLLAILLTAAVSVVQNSAENSGVIPTLLKDKVVRE